MNIRRGRRRDEPEINLIPLIDVLLVILIFLMVTTSYQQLSQMQVTLPTAQGNPLMMPRKAVTIELFADGSIRLGDQRLHAGDWSALTARLRNEAPDTPVIIGGDGRAPYQWVVSVMQCARDAGLSNVTLPLQSPQQ